jgi:hypothetical protein
VARHAANRVGGRIDEPGGRDSLLEAPTVNRRLWIRLGTLNKECFGYIT